MQSNRGPYVTDDDEIQLVMERAKEWDCSLKTARYLLSLEQHVGWALQALEGRLSVLERSSRSPSTSTGARPIGDTESQDRAQKQQRLRKQDRERNRRETSELVAEWRKKKGI